MCDQACTDAINALSNNLQFDVAAFELGVQGVLTIWAVGLGVGLIISVVRKLRTP